MEDNITLITISEAISLLPFGRRGLDSLIKKGEIGFKKVNGRYYFPETEIRRWVNDLEYHTKYTKEETYTGRTSRLLTQKEEGIGLEKLLELQALKKQNNTATQGYQSYKRK